MSSGKRRQLPSSDPLYILGLLDGNSSDESDSDLYSESDDEQPDHSPKSPTSSFQSYPMESLTSSFQSYQLQASTSSFQRLEPTLTPFQSSIASSSPTLTTTTLPTCSFQSNVSPASTRSIQCSPPPLPPPIATPSCSFIATSVEHTSCSSSTGVIHYNDNILILYLCRSYCSQLC